MVNVNRSFMREHFCSFNCEDKNEPCDLCKTQRQYIQDQKLLAAGKPTLHVTFGDLLRRKQ